MTELRASALTGRTAFSDIFKGSHEDFGNITFQFLFRALRDLRGEKSVSTFVAALPH
jgi:hypothetical protein